MLRHEIITTEKVVLSYRVAGLGVRLLAWLVDVGIMVVLGTLGVLMAGVFDVVRPGVGMAVLMIWLFVLQWGYFLFFEWLWHGQTPGKRLVGIRVLSRKGTSPSFFEAAVRNIVRWVDAFPGFLMLVPCYGVGFLAAMSNRENRRLGDLAAGTLVVYVQRQRSLIRALHDMRQDEDWGNAWGMRQRLEGLDRAQKQTLLDLCLRRDQLRVSDRARLFAAVAEYARNQLGLEAEEFQSDEKFVLRLARVLTSEPNTQEQMSGRR